MTSDDTDVERGFVERGFVHTAGFRLGYVAAGSGPLMLLHHGFPSCGATFRNEVVEFSDTYRVVAIDGLGANHSSKPADLDAYMNVVNTVRAFWLTTVQLPPDQGSD